MNKYTKIVDNELYYNNIKLMDLIKEYKTPLKVTFLDIIKDRVSTLKDAFNRAILATNYQGNFIYLNANKANYGIEEIESSFSVSDGLETSSYNDLLLTFELFKKHKEYKNKYIVCNGFKLADYIDEIVKISKLGYKIIDIIDSISEYEYLKSINASIEVGLRIHVSSKYIEEISTIRNDRFGITDNEFNYIINDLKNTNLSLSTIHFHQRGMEFEEDKFEENFRYVFDYYVKASKRFDTVKYFNIGGGAPLLKDEEFDYYSFAVYVLKLLIKLSKENDINTPNIITENGRFSMKDSSINIYKVISKKKFDEYTWNIVDGSILIAIPEIALGEEFVFLPVNGFDKKMVESYLAGVTCDCDDVYYEKDKGYINLPDIDDLYITILGTGSYQNSMNGKGGVHHCLLSEEKDLLIDSINGEVSIKVRNELQNIDDILRISNFKE